MSFTSHPYLGLSVFYITLYNSHSSYVSGRSNRGQLDSYYLPLNILKPTPPQDSCRSPGAGGGGCREGWGWKVVEWVLHSHRALRH